MFVTDTHTKVEMHISIPETIEKNTTQLGTWEVRGHLSGMFHSVSYKHRHHDSL